MVLLLGSCSTVLGPALVDTLIFWKTTHLTALFTDGPPQLLLTAISSISTMPSPLFLMERSKVEWHLLSFCTPFHKS